MTTESKISPVSPEKTVTRVNPLDQISIKAKTDKALRKTTEKLWLAFLQGSNNETLKFFLSQDPALAKKAFCNHSDQVPPGSFLEAKKVMDEFCLSEKTRKAYLLSLTFHEWIEGNNFYQYTPDVFPFTVSRGIIDYCTEDFTGKLPDNSQETIRKFLFQMVNFIIQYNACIFPETVWKNSRQARQDAIERELKKGEKFLTTFIS